MVERHPFAATVQVNASISTVVGDCVKWQETKLFLRYVFSISTCLLAMASGTSAEVRQFLSGFLGPTHPLILLGDCPVLFFIRPLSTLKC